MVILIFYYGVTNSAAVNLFSSSAVLNYVKYILIAISLGLFLIAFLLYWSSQNVVRTFLLTFFLVLTLVLGDHKLYPAIYFAMYLSYLGIYDIIKVYFKSVFCTLIIVSFLSLIGILSIKENDLWLFGFSNPNTTGLIITICLLSYTTLNWRKFSYKYYVVMIISIAFEGLILNDNTALIVTLLYMVLSILLRKGKLIKVVQDIAMVLPTTLALFSWIIARLYGKYNWTSTLDGLLTHRPQIWSFYIANYPLKLLPQRFVTYQASNFQLKNMNGYIGNVYSGAFDSSYLYTLISSGLIISLFILFILTIYIYITRNDIALTCFNLSFVLFGFAETNAISALGYYESCVMVLSLIVFFNACAKKLVKGRLQ